MLHYLPVGDIGKHRDEFLAKVHKRAGKGNWFWAFRVGKKLYSWELGIQLYEDAYWQFLRSDISLIKELLGYFNVFVYDRHDLDSGLDYKIQNNSRDHFQDIAIRRCLIRFGVWFNGKDIMEINGSKFDHNQVPFHLPHLINKPDINKSLRSFMFSNRLIVIAPELEDKAKLSEILIK